MAEQILGSSVIQAGNDANGAANESQNQIRQISDSTGSAKDTANTARDQGREAESASKPHVDVIANAKSYPLDLGDGWIQISDDAKLFVGEPAAGFTPEQLAAFDSLVIRALVTSVGFVLGSSDQEIEYAINEFPKVLGLEPRGPTVVTLVDEDGNVAKSVPVETRIGIVLPRAAPRRVRNTTPSPALRGSPYHPDSVAARVRPPYRPNPAHDPRSPSFNPRKTPEPSDAASVYENAVRSGMGEWFGVAQNGKIYRFFSDNAGGVHFSGEVLESAVPKGVRELLGL
jgi:hypothetical protein